jgi:membrane-bound serine protease (ClpP class)
LRIVAFLPENIEGHALLPVLACQEVFAKSGIEIGKAAVDSEADATVQAAYRDMVARGRTNIPTEVVQAMLTPNVELRRVSTTNDSSTRVVNLEQLEKLKSEGLLSEASDTIWAGRGLASFSSDQMRNWLWISPLVQTPTELAEKLGVDSSLRTVQQLPRDWKGATVKIDRELERADVNRIIRSIHESTTKHGVNLIVFLFDDAKCDLDDASRLASTIADLRDKVYTAGYVQTDLRGPIGLVATACNETVLIGEATLGPDLEAPHTLSDGAAELRILTHLASATERPLPLLAAMVDKHAEVNIYIHQDTLKREMFTANQVAQQVDREKLVPKNKIAGGQPISQEVALQYALVNGIEKSTSLGLSRLGIEQLPATIETPWLEATIQGILALRWVPRLLLMIGLMALMIELGNPGISVGGLVAGLCFLGFFWIEMLNGNVEWLEILLFVGGLFALAIELFVLPGFGIFGITGLFMVFTSLVLAGQTFVWPTSSGEVNQLAANLFWVAFLGFAGMIGLLLLHKQLERLPMFRWLSLQPGGAAELEELEQREQVVSYDFLLGEIGTTKTRLNPAGKAQFGDHIVSVIGSGGLIDSGVPVQVVEVRGNLVIVEECQ